MAVEPADDQIHPIRQAVAVTADDDERTVRDEGCQLTLQSRSFLPRNLEQANELSCGGRVVYLFTHLAQQLIAGGHRRILECLTCLWCLGV